MLYLGMIVTYGLYDLDVSVGHMMYVYFQCAVLHMLCVMVLHLV